MVAFRSVAVPLLGGGALLAGYATVSWLRGRQAREAAQPETEERESEPAPRSGTFTRGLEPLELDLEQELNENRRLENDRGAPEKIGSLFLGRALEALSPFEAPPAPRVTSERDPLDFEEEDELGLPEGGLGVKAGT